MIPKPKNRALERKRLIKRLDIAFSKWIRKRDKNKCVTCGTRQNPTAGHLFSRGSHSTRWDELNTHCQCSGCNFRHESYPDYYTRWFIKKYGQEAYFDLALKAHKTHKFTMSELQALLNKYEAVSAEKRHSGKAHRRKPHHVQEETGGDSPRTAS